MIKIQKERFTSALILFLIFAFLSACASSIQRFPDFREVAKQNTTIPIVLDLFVYRDMAGTDRGVDFELTQRSIDSAILRLEEDLGEYVYKINLITSLNGLAHEIKDDKEYLITEGWKPTGEPYEHIDLKETNDAWYTEENRKFLNALRSTAREINARAKIDQSEAEKKLVEKNNKSPDKQIPLLSNLAVPSIIAEDSEYDVVMFVLIDGYFQSTGKYIGQSLLIGGVSAALTGGALIASSAGTQVVADIIVFDKKTKKILWHGTKPGSTKSAVSYAITNVLGGYPNTDGLTAWEREKNRKKKKRQ